MSFVCLWAVTGTTQLIELERVCLKVDKKMDRKQHGECLSVGQTVNRSVGLSVFSTIACLSVVCVCLSLSVSLSCLCEHVVCHLPGPCVDLSGWVTHTAAGSLTPLTCRASRQSELCSSAFHSHYWLVEGSCAPVGENSRMI